MRTLILSAIMLSGMISFGQVPRFQRFDMGTSGVQGYFPADPEFELTYSEDSSMVFTGEAVTDSFNYFAICVKFSEPLDGTVGEQVDLLESYLDYLQDAFGVVKSAGYGEGHTLEYYSDVNGVIDYWEDTEENQWSVKGWVNTKYLVVMGIYGPYDYPYFNAQEMYLDGVRFPE